LSSPKVIESIVKNDLCIGCGLCTISCNSQALEMNLNKYGFYEPEQINHCNCNGDCIKVCPFNPLDDFKKYDEDYLSREFLFDSQFNNPQIGSYTNLYVGYSPKYRLTSSSGGLATSILTKLLNEKKVDYVISVKESLNNHFEYKISHNCEELLKSSKTRYYPVTLATVFKKIEELEGNFAIVGVGCFLKGIRLYQKNNPKQGLKIKFLIGIICGGVKSSFFTEYLSSKLGYDNNSFKTPHYRIKDLTSKASDYSYGCRSKITDDFKTLKMKSVGDMWGTGLFKANACDLCDDVTTELADISLGDAWIEPYVSDGAGTSVLITRSKKGNELIERLILDKELNLKPISLDKFLSSQRASFNHRRLALPFRQRLMKINGYLTPQKRNFKSKKINLSSKIVQYLRMKVRSSSLEIWHKTRTAKEFDVKMKLLLFTLSFFTKLNTLVNAYQQGKLIEKLKEKTFKKS
jgi:coenzyme F420 hydrogenase subunit beta